MMEAISELTTRPMFRYGLPMNEARSLGRARNSMRHIQWLISCNK